MTTARANTAAWAAQNNEPVAAGGEQQQPASNTAAAAAPAPQSPPLPRQQRAPIRPMSVAAQARLIQAQRRSGL
jgi:hypothetical protein